jgi:hypothetical protein
LRKGARQQGKGFASRLNRKAGKFLAWRSA